MRLDSGAFIITPLKRVRTCPNLYMSTNNLSPGAIKKEILIGSTMAMANAFFMNEYHHVTSYDELENYYHY